MKTESKHTPGPWKIGDFGLILGGKNDSIIATLEGINRDDNAKLIASAPELLEACKEALEKSHDPAVEIILIEAIAKAEGNQ
jgi:hypothetical protein